MVIVAATAVLFGAPASADAPRFDAATTVEAMNRDGFADFAAIDARVATPTVSSLLSWYVHRFLARTSPDAHTRALVEQLRRSGLVFDTTMHAARGRSAYTDAVASRESAELAAKTVWDQPPADTFAWELDVAIRTHDALDGRGANDPDDASVQGAFYTRDGLDAVRLSAAEGYPTTEGSGKLRAIGTVRSGRHGPYALFHRLTVNVAIPMLYVVQDTRTGAILLMGQNG